MNKNENALQSRVKAIIAAFKEDGYDVDLGSGIFYYRTVDPGSDKFAVMAQHRTATINGTGKKKKAFYLEGTPRQWLPWQRKFAGIIDWLWKTLGSIVD